MILQYRNVVRRTDDAAKIAELKAQGYREKTRAAIVESAVVGTMPTADVEEVDLMKLTKKELAALVGISGAHKTKSEIIALIEGEKI